MSQYSAQQQAELAAQQQAQLAQQAAAMQQAQLMDPAAQAAHMAALHHQQQQVRHTLRYLRVTGYQHK